LSVADRQHIPVRRPREEICVGIIYAPLEHLNI
jgi:hypothetical protein